MKCVICDEDVPLDMSGTNAKAIHLQCIKRLVTTSKDTKQGWDLVGAPFHWESYDKGFDAGMQQAMSRIQKDMQRFKNPRLDSPLDRKDK